MQNVDDCSPPNHNDVYHSSVFVSRLREMKKSALLCSVITGTLILGVIQANPALAKIPSVPQAESNLFILDVSKSLITQDLWFSLRDSIQEKLVQPFGNPKGKKSLAKPSVDISVSIISKVSANSPFFNIVNRSDSDEVWKTIENRISGLNAVRIDEINKALFDSGGVWAEQAEIFKQETVIAPNEGSCRNSMLNSMKTRTWVKNLNKKIQTELSVKLCKKLIDIAARYNKVDSYLVSPICKDSDRCSDVTGAILKSTSYAADLVATSKSNPALCIAIASDMLNDSVGNIKRSSLDSEYHALNSKSEADARTIGANAARSVGAQFPKSVKTKVVMVGLGSGPKPIPLNRSSHLVAYWSGFFSAAGISQAGQSQSINRACA